MSKASKYMLTLGKKTTIVPRNFNIHMGHTVLERVKSIKYLGVIFDEKFKWKEHVSYLSSKLACSVGVLSKLRYYTNIPTLIKVYHSLICSHLNYGLIVWGAAGTTALKPVRVLQNRAIRFISRAPRRHKLDIAYLNLRILKLNDLHSLAKHKFMHQYHHNKLPDYFSDFFAKTPIQHPNFRRNPLANLMAMDCKKKFTERSIRYTGPTIWGKVPLLKRELSPSKFRKEFTNHFLAQY